MSRHIPATSRPIEIHPPTSLLFSSVWRLWLRIWEAQEKTFASNANRAWLVMTRISIVPKKKILKQKRKQWHLRSDFDGARTQQTPAISTAYTASRRTFSFFFSQFSYHHFFHNNLLIFRFMSIYKTTELIVMARHNHTQISFSPVLLTGS